MGKIISVFINNAWQRGADARLYRNDDRGAARGSDSVMGGSTGALM